MQQGHGVPLANEDDDVATTAKNSDTIAKLHAGQLQVLVATDVAEEGLVILPCRLVIRFNPMVSISSYTKACGRGRHSQAQYIIMMDREDSSEAEHLEQIRGYSEIMNELIAKSKVRVRASVEASMPNCPDTPFSRSSGHSTSSSSHSSSSHSSSSGSWRRNSPINEIVVPSRDSRKEQHQSAKTTAPDIDSVSKQQHCTVAWSAPSSALARRRGDEDQDAEVAARKDLRTLIRRRGLPSGDESAYMVPSTGAVVTLQSSIALVHQYCDLLTKDPYCSMRPEFSIEEGMAGESGLYRCVITLPSASSTTVKQVQGGWATSKLGAKQRVCLLACRLLHQARGLDDHLNPLIVSIDKIADAERAAPAPYFGLSMRSNLRPYPGLHANAPWASLLPRTEAMDLVSILATAPKKHVHVPVVDNSSLHRKLLLTNQFDSSSFSRTIECGDKVEDANILSIEGMDSVSISQLQCVPSSAQPSELTEFSTVSAFEQQPLQSLQLQAEGSTDGQEYGQGQEEGGSFHASIEDFNVHPEQIFVLRMHISSSTIDAEIRYGILTVESISDEIKMSFVYANANHALSCDYVSDIELTGAQMWLIQRYFGALISAFSPSRYQATLRRPPLELSPIHVVPLTGPDSDAIDWAEIERVNWELDESHNGRMSLRAAMSTYGLEAVREITTHRIVNNIFCGNRRMQIFSVVEGVYFKNVKLIVGGKKMGSLHNYMRNSNGKHFRDYHGVRPHLLFLARRAPTVTSVTDGKLTSLGISDELVPLPPPLQGVDLDPFLEEDFGGSDDGEEGQETGDGAEVGTEGELATAGTEEPYGKIDYSQLPRWKLHVQHKNDIL